MKRPTGIFKTTNEYAQSLPPEVYEGIPKAVFAAIAISFVTCGGDHIDEATSAIIKEWRILNENGIVPQSVPSALRKLEKQEDTDD